MAGRPDIKNGWRVEILPLRLVLPAGAQDGVFPQPKEEGRKSGTIPVMEKPIAVSAFCFEI